jgi:peroxiredoxin
MRALLTLFACSAMLFGAGELSGRRAPGFSLADFKAVQHDLADYRGKYVLVEFFQSTCPHCSTFATIMVEASQKYAARAATLSIAVMPDPAQDVLRFAQAHKVTFPVLFDCGQVAAAYYKASPSNPSISFPHLFVVDPQGRIVQDWGYNLLNRDIFEGRGLFRELDKIMGGGAPASKKK